jgi:uncharacterized SAM-binding protein YcdF (DUF218 family)
MFFLLSKILDVLVSPLAWVLVLAIAAAVTDRREVARGLAGLAAVVLYVFSTGFVASRMARELESSAARTMRDDVTYDVVIVLGGMVDDQISATWGEPAYNDNVERLLVPYDLLRTGRARSAILSSGVGHFGDGIPEADILVDQLARWGIAKERLVPERASRNTHENAVESKRLVDQRGDKTVLVVTSAFHMSRAAGCFKKVGLTVDTLPVDRRTAAPRFTPMELIPRAGNLHECAHVIHEWVGRVVYRLRGYT